MRYASGTSVSAERTREQMMRILRQFGADGFGYAERHLQGAVQFQYHKIPVQFRVRLPSRSDDGIACTDTGRERSANQREQFWQRETNRRWRAVFLVIKALLVGVEEGVITFEEAFLPYIVWQDGRTTADILLPPIQAAAESGALPLLLPEQAGPPRVETGPSAVLGKKGTRHA